MRRVLGVAIAAIVALGGSVLALTFPLGGPRTYTVKASFEKTIGLFEDTDVRVLGVPVGSVTEVTPRGDQVEVVMEIATEHKIPADAVATLVPISLISDRYVQLSPPYVSGPALEDGAVLARSKTFIPYELDDLLASLERLLSALEAGTLDDPGALSSAINNLSSTLEGTGDDLSETLEGGGAIAGVINSNAARLDSAVASLAGLVDALSAKRNELAQLNRRLSSSLGAIADESAALDAALGNISTLTAELGDLIRDNRSTLTADLQTLAKTTQVVVRNQESVIRANDWLHVLSDGLEASHNGGAVHAVSTDPTHIDVRDAHYGVCPIPFIGCNFDPTIINSTSASAGPAVSREDRPTLIRELTRQAGDEVPHLPDTSKPIAASSFDEQRQPWYIVVGRWFSGLFGGRR